MSNKLAVAALLILGGAHVQACEIWRDPELGLWRGECSLADFKGKYLVQQDILDGLATRVRLKMPDLQIRKFKFTVNGAQVQVDAEIENIGDQSSFATDLAVTVDIGNPVTGMQQVATSSFPVAVPALGVGMRQRFLVGFVNVPNNLQDWDLVVWGVVDPPTPAQPVRGRVIESDETNNTLAHMCRWFGPTPNVGLEPCN